jgi:4-amino-4-deoxy-L-arabinose transferase-like glycosyltransferase
VDIKPPLILYLYGFAQAVLPDSPLIPRLLGLAAVLGTGMLLYRIARLYVRAELALLAPIVFGFASFWTVVDGPYFGMTETFLALTVVIAVLITIRHGHRGASPGWALLVGLLLGIAVHWKQVGLFSALGVFAIRLDGGGRWDARPADLLKDIPLALLGMGAGLLASLAPALATGSTLGEYIWSVWWLPGQPGVNAGNLARLRGFVEVLTQTRFVFVLPAAALLIARRSHFASRGIPWAGLLAWTGFELLGASASGKFYGHYLRQPLPPVALVVTLAVAELWRLTHTYQLPRRSRLRAMVWTVAVCTLVAAADLAHPQAWLQLARGEPRGREKAMVDAANVVRQVTRPGETITVWSPHASLVHVRADRLAPSPWFYTLFLGTEGVEDSLVTHMLRRPPGAILLPERMAQPLPDRVGALLDTGYVHSPMPAGEFRLYLRDTGTEAKP